MGLPYNYCLTLLMKVAGQRWLQCCNCYLVIHLNETPRREQIKNAIELTDNRYQDKTVIESLPKRKFSKTGKPVKRKLCKKKIRSTNEGNHNYSLIFFDMS